jgi:hypothetical protein
VAVPTEHGGWGLTLEPAVLGLLVAPGASGAALAVAALVAFVARTPLRVVLVERWRGRSGTRGRAALGVLAVEAMALTALVAVAAVTASAPFWPPLVAAAPLVVLELWFDMRSRSRRLAPELAGAVGIGSVAAAIALAGGEGAALAVGLWAVVAARSVTSVPHVRALIARLHGRPVAPAPLLVADLAAVAVAGAAVVLAPSLWPGALGVAAVVVIQRATATRPLPAARVIGLRQMALGFAVVALAALGVRLG